MQYIFSLLFLLSISNAYGLSEPQAGELCGGWYVADRSELDDEVFYECVKTKKLDRRFVETESRYKNARKLCVKNGWKDIKFCMQKMLSVPSRLAIRETKPNPNRAIASEKNKKK